MQLASIVLLVTCLQVSAAVHGQKVTIVDEQVALKKVFKEIRKQTDYNFIYTNKIIQQASPVSLNVKDASIEEVLNQCFAGQPLTYTIEDKIIIVTPKSDLSVVQKPAAIEITGLVTDSATGQPLVGVTIKVKGGLAGTVTDAQGKFRLEVPDNALLVVSYLGYTAKEIPVDGRNDIVISLAATTTELNQLVVIGYGSVRKENLTGSVSSISGRDLENIPASRVDQILQGRATGMQVTQQSGEPGSGSVIRIRGGNSIQGNNDPLFVIDGFIAGTGFNLNNMNTNDIKSIEVLKDATSIAIYGTRGSNGVILITTKDGKGTGAGESRITFSSYLGKQYMMNAVDFLNGAQHAAYANEEAEYRGGIAPFDNPDGVPNVNWLDQITRDAPIANMDLSLSGQSTNRKINYYISGNYFDQEGIVRNSGYEKFMFRSNLDFRLSDAVRTGFRLTGSRKIDNKNKVNFSGILSGELPERAIYNDDGVYTAENPISGTVRRNPEADIQLRENALSQTFVLGNFYLEVEPIKNLILRTTFGTRLVSSKTNTYNPAILPEHAVSNEGGDGGIRVSTGTILLNENTINYSTDLGMNQKIDLLGGFTWQTSESESVDAHAYGFANDALKYNDLSTGSDPIRNGVGSSWDSYQLVSWLGRVHYSFKDRYLLTLVGRVDGSSRFSGSNNEYGFFPSAAVAWRLSEEPFIQKMNVFNTLKLRASYGTSGSQAIGSYRTLPLLNGTSAYFNDVEQTAVQNGRPYNDNLKWETTRQLDIGLEAAFWKGRLSLEADYYNKITKDLLLDVLIPRQTGFSTKLQNLGSIRNRGLELKINTVNISRRNFQWSSMLAVSRNRNKVLDLAGAEFINAASPTNGGPGGRLIVGQPVPVFVGVEYLGTWKSQPEIDQSGQTGQHVGGPRFKDTDGNGQVNLDDFEILGTPQPDFFGGVRNTFTYKNWTLDVFIEGTYGNEIYNSLTQAAFFGRADERNKYAETINRWTPQNPNSNIPRAGAIITLGDVYSNSEMVEDGSYLRLKSLMLSYNLPVDKLGLSRFKDMSVYFSGSNLYLLSSFRLFDPEVSQYGSSNTNIGFSQGEYPYGRTLTFGIKVTL